MTKFLFCFLRKYQIKLCKLCYMENFLHPFIIVHQEFHLKHFCTIRIQALCIELIETNNRRNLFVMFHLLELTKKQITFTIDYVPRSQLLVPTLVWGYDKSLHSNHLLLLSCSSSDDKYWLFEIIYIKCLCVKRDVSQCVFIDGMFGDKCARRWEYQREVSGYNFCHVSIDVSLFSECT